MGLHCHALTQEMPELSGAIHDLKSADPHFAKLLHKYEELNKEIYKVEHDLDPASDRRWEILKKERLTLKDELFRMLKEKEAA